MSLLPFDEILETLWQEAADSRAAVLDAVRARLRDTREDLDSKLSSNTMDGPAYAAGLSGAMDEIIRALFRLVTKRVVRTGIETKGERMALVAVGGYGRGELCPFSDIDLLFLHDSKITPRHEQVVETFLYMIWDLGWKVGQSTRSVSECLRQAKDDVTIATALLEARLLDGHAPLFQELARGLRTKVIKGSELAYLHAKKEERAAKQEADEASRYQVEPDLKEGPGGLRDLHTVQWIARYAVDAVGAGGMERLGFITKAEAREFRKARRFLLTVRCHLHLLAGRAEERLTFEMQRALAERLDFADRPGASAVERFMKAYHLNARSVGVLSRLVIALIQEELQGFRMRNLLPTRARGPFVVRGGFLQARDPDQFADEPRLMLAVFLEALKGGHHVHPATLMAVRRYTRLIRDLRQDDEANALFVEILTGKHDPERTLRHMNEYGLLGAFVPEFGRIVCQMQFDMYHSYTVDEHTIRTVGILHRIELGQMSDILPVATEAIGKVKERRAIYLGMLCHDIAKGQGGNHSEKGIKVAQRLGKRFGFSAHEIETAAWLVHYHLAMSHMAFKRDLEDPVTVDQFCSVVQSTERLNALLALTCADIRAVGPTIWNSWKAALLKHLYDLAVVRLEGLPWARNRDARVAAARKALAEALTHWPAAARKTHLASGYPGYWLSFDTEALVRHAEQRREAREQGLPLSIRVHGDPDRAAFEVTILCPDAPGLLATAATGIALSNGSIVEAKVVTFPDGTSLSSSWVQHPDVGFAQDEARVARFKASLTKILAGETKTEPKIAPMRREGLRRRRSFRVAPRVLVDNAASRRATVIEVNGMDRPGFLGDVARVITNQGFMIDGAFVTTYGERAVDTFYVTDLFRQKVMEARKLDDLRDALMAMLQGYTEAAQKPAAA